MPFSNQYGYDSAAMNDIIAKAAVATDDDERSRLYRDFQALAAEDLPLIPVAEFTFITVARDSVRNVANNPRWATSHWADTGLRSVTRRAGAMRSLTVVGLRLLAAVPTLFLVSLGAYLLLESAPGDAADAYLAQTGGDAGFAAALRERLGLAGSLAARLLRFYAGLGAGRSRHLRGVRPAGRSR